MKIKRKVQKNLPQLIEWAQDNIEEATKKVYRVNENEVLGDHVRFTEVCSDLQVRLHGYIPFNTTFTVEVEKEITEDTVIDNLYKMDEFYEFYSTEYKTVKDVIRHSVFKVKAVYLNDDLTMTLIWCNGKLVE